MKNQQISAKILLTMIEKKCTVIEACREVLGDGFDKMIDELHGDLAAAK